MPSTRTQRKNTDVKKDPLDLRDVLYEPSLGELPFKRIPKWASFNILDQGNEGACTGFGLAATANYLLNNRSDRGKTAASVSPRMLYEMAKKYDEWDGNHYEGSSIRGAMKGWNRHGVCLDDAWPYDPSDAGRLTKERQENALQHRLGAYYRVRHTHLNHMHSALNEVGILVASASVHNGWDQVDQETGKIPFRPKPKGGHAFAIVGYDADGFWIQNSWGRNWGKNGFCHLSYEDWLENGMDCWVARLGVPTATRPLDATVGGRVSKFDHLPHEAAVLSDIHPHVVNLGNDGALSQFGRFTSNEDSVKAVVSTMKSTMKTWGGRRKLMLYAHGGLTPEKAAPGTIKRMLPPFKANQIYPIHFIWETGLVESIRDIVEDSLRRGRFFGWRDAMKDRFYDLLDEGIELAARKPGRLVWGEMKENAQGASMDASTQRPEGGARYLARTIAEQFHDEGPPEIHLVGHSAGAIFHAYLAPLLKELGLPISSMTLLAPACTMKLFKENIVPILGSGIERLTIFNLTDDYEQDDDIASIYHKSILYLLSEACEPEKVGTALLGMNKFVQKDRAVKKKLGKPRPGSKSTVIYSVGGRDNVKLESSSEGHTDFDDDADTLNSTLRIIQRSDRIRSPFLEGR